VEAVVTFAVELPYGDDSQIVRLTIEKHAPVAGGKTLVEIRNA
jgi:hypothetical protein